VVVAASARKRVRGDVARLVHRHLGVQDFSRAVTRILRRAVPFDGVCLLTVDPATLLPTGEVVEDGLPAAAMIRLTEIELREPDFNKFTALARTDQPTASLSGATAGDLDRSLRQRELRRPSGFADELRAVLSGTTGTWGALTLLREARSPHFTPAEVRFVASLAGALAGGLRRAALIGDAVDGGGGDTGLLVLAADGTVEMANPAAGRWLDELGAGDRPGGHLPLAVRAGGPAACLARARIRTPAGRWVVVRGSLLGDGPGSRVAVLLEAAPPARAGSADHRCVWRHRTQAASHRAGGAGPPDQRDRRATAPVGVHGAGPPEVDLREVWYRLARRTRSPALLRPLPATPDPARHPRNLGSALTPVADNPGGAG